MKAKKKKGRHRRRDGAHHQYFTPFPPGFRRQGAELHQAAVLLAQDGVRAAGPGRDGRLAPGPRVCEQGGWPGRAWPPETLWVVAGRVAILVGGGPTPRQAFPYFRGRQFF